MQRKGKVVVVVIITKVNKQKQNKKYGNIFYQNRKVKLIQNPAVSPAEESSTFKVLLISTSIHRK